MEKQNIFEIVFLVLTNGFTWFMTRRKYQEEVASQEILNLTSTFEFYKTIISDLQDRVSELNKKIDKMEEEIVTLRTENETLKKLKKYENL